MALYGMCARAFETRLPAGMPWRRSCGTTIHAFPAFLFARRLLVEPFFERGAIIKDGSSIHLPLAADTFQRVRPGTGLAPAEHFIHAFSATCVCVDGATVQRPVNGYRLAPIAAKLHPTNPRRHIAL